MKRFIQRGLIVGMFLVALAATSVLLSGAVQAPPGPQQNPPPPPESYAQESPEQLQQLVAPIALYPDELVASMLAASSYPAEIAQANDWLAPRANLPPDQLASEADQQNWDPSVKSLLPFPPVLKNLASNLSWTSELGDAYRNQPTDVMNAIQHMRREAKKAGTLKSNDQIRVRDKDGYITIEPASPKDVYVPAYDPWEAYGYPIEPWPGWVDVPGVWWGGPGLYFGLGFGMGPFLGYGWGWGGWGVDWYGRGLWFHGAPYWGGGPAFFNRYDYYHGYPGFNGGYRGFYNRGYPGGFAGRPGGPDIGRSRGFTGPQNGARLRSGPFSGFNYGGAVRGFSARGQQSFGGGFRGGGFAGGGFHGGGGGFHGGGGRR